MNKKKSKSKDRLKDMEELLTRALEPGSRLFAYIENELVSGEDGTSGKPDAKPLREVASVLVQVRELRGGECAHELTIVFADPEQAKWAE